MSQPLIDGESWDLDVWRLTMDGEVNNAVPEPLDLAMIVLGFGAMGWPMLQKKHGQSVKYNFALRELRHPGSCAAELRYQAKTGILSIKVGSPFVLRAV